MAEDLHPNWHRTDSASAATSKTHRTAASIPLHDIRVSRLPGAIAGIVLVLGLGFIFFRGVSHIRGQLLEEITMTISPGAVNPADITARPGQQIAWINRDQLPHIIVSQTLCSASAGTCLGTDIFFEGSTMRYTIPTDAPGGAHTFFSEIDPSITGTITITGEIVTQEDATAIPQQDIPTTTESSTADPPPEEQNDQIPMDEPPAESGGDLLTRLLIQQQSQQPSDTPPTAPHDDPADIALTQPETEQEENILALAEDSVQVAPRAQTGIPRNPYTVGSPLTAAMQSTAESAPLHSGAPAEPVPPVYQHKPIAQPQTGSAAALAILATVAIGGYAAYRTLRRSTVVLAA
ncbi:MAG: hypothetical protein WCX29_01350 [Candidatus Peribacteraceae bacterium]